MNRGMTGNFVACVDVHYGPAAAVAAAVVFKSGPPEVVIAQHRRFVSEAAEYVPGQFYRRELPGLLAVLACIKEPLSLVVIDGYVWLADGKPGLGARLYEGLGKGVPVVGVAKSPFAGSVPALQVYRGASRKPLYVTSVGVDLEQAARWVRDLGGDHRIPDVLKRVDRVARLGKTRPFGHHYTGSHREGNAGVEHKFSPENWAKLESPERRAALPPEQILERIGVETGDVFVDVGAGTGYFAIPAAKRIGPAGVVWAVDISQQMLDIVTERRAASTDEAAPVKPILSEETAIPLDSGIAQHVFNSTVLHEIALKERHVFVAEMARLLAPGGRLTILDWAPTPERTQGPPLHIRLGRAEVEKLLKGAGLDVVRSEDFGADFYIVQGRTRN